MPTYRYQCDECKLIFEQFHSMAETVEKCEKCGFSVKRLVSISSNIKKNKNFGKQKPGKIVRQYIKDAKEDVKEEKRRLATAEYVTK